MFMLSSPFLVCLPLLFLGFSCSSSCDAPSEGGKERPCFSTMFSFGDSLSDVGNLAFLNVPSEIKSVAFRSPYGETFFRRPTGRYSDGRLVIDFISQALGLPFLSPALDPGANFTHGASFSVSGATVLDSEVLQTQGAPNISSFSLSRQLDLFRAFKANHLKPTNSFSLSRQLDLFKAVKANPSSMASTSAGELSHQHNRFRTFKANHSSSSLFAASTSTKSPSSLAATSTDSSTLTSTTMAKSSSSKSTPTVTSTLDSNLAKPMCSDSSLAKSSTLGSTSTKSFAMVTDSSANMANYFSDALYVVNEIGANDITFIREGGKGFRYLYSLVPTIVAKAESFLQILVENEGAKFLVVEGTPPMGCAPMYRNTTTTFTVPVTDIGRRDDLGCIVAINRIMQRYNQLLRSAISKIRARHPEVQIAFFDSYGAHMEAYRNAGTHGLREIAAPCYEPGPPSFLCGDPCNRVFWDYAHFTEVVNRDATLKYLVGGYSEPTHNFLARTCCLPKNII